jgi:hypothetical protein
MTYQDRNEYADPNNPRRPDRPGGWSPGTMIAAIVVLALFVGAIVAMNRGDTTTASGPATTQSAPSTMGQSGPTAPTGTAR